MEREHIQLKTKDGVLLHGTYVSAGKSDAPAVVLLHMMPAVKESWAEFQAALPKAGFQSLAIDLRGHGESVRKGDQRLDYKEFSDEEHQEKFYDAEAAAGFFLDRGIPLSSIALVGASIGANVALWYQAEHNEVKASVLLSPGLDYRGVKTEPYARALGEQQSVFLAASKDDARSSGEPCADMARVLFDAARSENKKIKIFDGAEHGTDMFGAHPELTDEIIRWLKDVYL